MPAEGRRTQALAALALFSAASIFFFGRQALSDPAHVWVGTGNSDPATYLWALAWWPYAVLHGLNPFFTHLIFVPAGFDLVANAPLAPGAGLLAAPITLTAGPLVAYDVLMLASPALSAWFAFLLCRYLTGRFWPSLLGGWVYGFSAFMLSELPGHLHVVLSAIPLPAAVLLVLRLLDGTIACGRFVCLMALALAAEVSFSTEVALTMCAFGALALAAGFVFAPGQARREIVVALKPLLLACAIAALIVSPILYYSLIASLPRGLSKLGDLFPADLLAPLVPTRLDLVGWRQGAPLVGRFVNGYGGSYFGAPLLAIVVLYLVSRWRTAAARVLALVIALSLLLSAGSHLYVLGHRVTALPWRLLGELPLLDQIIPTRIVTYAFLAAGAITALWLARPSRRPSARWTLAGLAVIATIPGLHTPYWHARPSDPTFFSSADKRYLAPGEVVLALPWGYRGMSMLWQARAGMSFRMAEGYASQVLPPSYAAEPLIASFLPASPPSPLGLAGASTAGQLRAFIVRRSVRAVLIDAANVGPWPGVLSRLGLAALRTGGVLLYRVPANW